jgi:hypothetical protein
MSAGAGDKVTVPVEMDAQGDEVATSFTLNFNPAKLSNPQIILGSDAPSGATLTINTESADHGKVMILVDSDTAFEKLSSPNRLILVTFDVAPDAASGKTQITFGSDPTAASVSDASAKLLPAVYENGDLTVAGVSSATYKVSGRVLTPDGGGLRGVTVTLTDENGNTLTAITSTFGYYSFDNVPGDTYTIAVESKRFHFEPRMIQLAGNLADVDLTGTEK